MNTEIDEWLQLFDGPRKPMTIAERKRKALRSLDKALHTLLPGPQRGGWTDPYDTFRDIKKAEVKLGLGSDPRSRIEAVALLAETVGHLNAVTKRYVLKAIAALTV